MGAVTGENLQESISLRLMMKPYKYVQSFYFDTLDITYTKTEYALKKSKNCTSGLSGLDNRGKHDKRVNKISDDATNVIKQHINSFARVESHFCRKNTKKEYLSQELNLTQMYNYYAEDCKKEGI